MNIKFLIAMLYSGVFLLFTGLLGIIWMGSIIGDFLVRAGAANLRDAHLNISQAPLLILSTTGAILIMLSMFLALKSKAKTPVESELPGN